MKEYEIIEMAKQAGIRFRTNVFHSGYCDGVHGDELEAFAKLVAEKEREACAKLCEEQYEYYGYDHIFAKAIRARGQE